MPNQKLIPGCIQKIGNQWRQVKYYVLFTENNREKIIFPIKAIKNYSQESKKKKSFAGGFPAMFGGNLEKTHLEEYEGDPNIETLKAEVKEESRYTYDVERNIENHYATIADNLEAVQRSNSYKITIMSYQDGQFNPKKIDNHSIHDDMKFYWTSSYDYSGEPFPPKNPAPKKFAEGEMEAIVTLKVQDIFTKANNSSEKKELIKALIDLAFQECKIQGDSEQKDQFKDSHTATAFYQFLVSEMSNR